MDNNFNNDNMQPNQFPQNNDYPPQGGGNDYSAQFAQYNQSRNPADGGNGDYNNPYQPQQPAQPDYNQYQPQQPVQPDYNQYQPQQPAQPDYNQYQPQQADYNQYNQYQDTNVQPYDYNQNGYQQPYDYNAGAQPADSMPADAPYLICMRYPFHDYLLLWFVHGYPRLDFCYCIKVKVQGKEHDGSAGLDFLYYRYGAFRYLDYRRDCFRYFQRQLQLPLLLLIIYQLRIDRAVKYLPDFC